MDNVPYHDNTCHGSQKCRYKSKCSGHLVKTCVFFKSGCGAAVMHYFCFGDC
jgi:hypothetical protein